MNPLRPAGKQKTPPRRTTSRGSRKGKEVKNKATAARDTSLPEETPPHSSLPAVLHSAFLPPPSPPCTLPACCVCCLLLRSCCCSCVRACCSIRRFDNEKVELCGLAPGFVVAWVILVFGGTQNPAWFCHVLDAPIMWPDAPPRSLSCVPFDPGL